MKKTEKIRKKNKPVLLSLIIPVYNQEKTIQKDIKRIIKVMDQLRYKYEIIVVIDGFIDKSLNKAKQIASKRVRVTGYKENKGKGHAVRFGMAKSKGSIIAFIDSGMDLNPNGISMLLEHFEWYKADIIIGSKLHPVSKVNYPVSRKLLSWGYRSVVRLLFGLSVRDTQVGMKFFRRKVLETILPRLLVKTYAFDIEILAVSHHLGFKRIYEAPVEIDFTGMSSITSGNFWNAITRMLWDTAAVFYRLKLLKYYDDSNEKQWKRETEIKKRKIKK